METLLMNRTRPNLEIEKRDESPLTMKIEALKNLASLLLKHLESLEKTPMLMNKKGHDIHTSLFDEVQMYEAELISEALIRAKGSQRKAARLLGTKASTLNAKIKRYGIDPYGLIERV